MSLLFNMLTRLVIAFLPRSKCLFISWLQSSSAVILEPKKLKSVTVSIVCPSVSHKVIEPDAMILVFWMLTFKSSFSLSSFTFIKRLFGSSLPKVEGQISYYNLNVSYGTCNICQVCFCLENPRDRGAWRAAIYGVAQNWIRLKRLSSSRGIMFKMYGIKS